MCFLSIHLSHFLCWYLIIYIPCLKWSFCYFFIYFFIMVHLHLLSIPTVHLFLPNQFFLFLLISCRLLSQHYLSSVFHFCSFHFYFTFDFFNFFSISPFWLYLSSISLSPYFHLSWYFYLYWLWWNVLSSLADFYLFLISLFLFQSSGRQNEKKELLKDQFDVRLSVCSSVKILVFMNG